MLQSIFASLHPRQHLFETCEEFLPTEPGAMKSLLLVRTEARLLHAQQRPRAGWRQRPGDDAVEPHGCPSVGQCLAGLDCQDLTVDGAPVGAKIESVIHRG